MSWVKWFDWMHQFLMSIIVDDKFCKNVAKFTNDIGSPKSCEKMTMGRVCFLAGLNTILGFLFMFFVHHIFWNKPCLCIWHSIAMIFLNFPNNSGSHSGVKSIIWWFISQILGMLHECEISLHEFCKFDPVAREIQIYWIGSSCRCGWSHDFGQLSRYFRAIILTMISVPHLRYDEVPKWNFLWWNRNQICAS